MRGDGWGGYWGRATGVGRWGGGTGLRVSEYSGGGWMPWISWSRAGSPLMIMER